MSYNKNVLVTYDDELTNTTYEVSGTKWVELKTNLDKLCTLPTQKKQAVLHTAKRGLFDHAQIADTQIAPNGLITASLAIYDQTRSNIYELKGTSWVPYIKNPGPLAQKGIYWFAYLFGRNNTVFVYMFSQYGGYDVWEYKSNKWTDLHFHENVSKMAEINGWLYVNTPTMAAYKLSV